MRLRGWHVEGFGLLRDYRVHDLPEGLSVVSGPNEAGKTSLLAFIRGVLFGFPSKKKKERQYPPLRGGRHGGRLYLVDSTGAEWTAERFASPGGLTLTQPDGSLGTDADLEQMLGHVDAELYRSVFAFSLAELQEFESLQVEGVRDRIFAAGVVGAGRSARDAIAALSAQRTEIARKKGDSRITGLRARIAEVDTSLGRARARAAAHPERRRALEDADAEQKRIGQSLAEARHKMASLDALLAAWPDWDESDRASAELAMLANAPDVPEDLASRLENALATLRTHSERRDDRLEAIQQLERRLSGLVPNERLAREAAEVRRLAGQSAAIRSRRDKLRDLQVRRSNLQGRIDEDAPLLGPGWTSESVRAFDVSIPTAQELADWSERLRVAQQVATDARGRATDAATTATQGQTEMTERARALEQAPPLPGEDELAFLESAVGNLRIRISELAGSRAELSATEQTLEERERRSREAREALGRAEGAVSRREVDLRQSPAVPERDELLARDRAVRQLRAALSEVALLEHQRQSADQKRAEGRERAEEAEASAAAKQGELERRRAACEARPLPDAGALAASERSIRELRVRLSSLAVLRTELEGARARLADSQAEAASRGWASAERLGWLLGGTGVLLAAVAAGLIFVGQTAAAAIVGGLALVVLLVGIRTIWRRPATDEVASARTGEAERAARALSHRVQEAEASARALASSLGFQSIPDALELETKAGEVAALVRDRQDREREVVALEQLRSETAHARDAWDRAKKAAVAATQDVESRATQVAVAGGSALTVATGLGFGRLPGPPELEEKAAENDELLRRRYERDRDNAGLEGLRAEAERTREAVRLAEEAVLNLRNGIRAAQVARVHEAEQAAKAVADGLGFTSLPDTAALEARGAEIARLIRARLDRDRELEALQELRQRASRASEAAARAGEAAEESRCEYEAACTKWSVWKAAHRCPEALRPETAQQFFTSVARLRENVAVVDGIDRESRSIEAELKAFSAAVEGVFERAGVEDPSSRPPDEAIGTLKERIEANAQVLQERAQRSEDLENARSAAARADRDRNLASGEVEAVFQDGGANDERECRLRIAASRQRAELKKRSQDADQRLRARLGAGSHAAAIRGELATGNCQAWEAAKQECKATLAQLQPAHEDALRRHQTALETLTSLEAECDVVTLATERESLIAEVREALVEWRRIAIAQALLQTTLRRYEIERQPAVLTRAADSYSRVTNGKYVRLASREDGVDVLAADGSRIDAAVLSRGSAEQLYLCLRLALAAEFGRLSVPLPLVMDDVLVNFDPERARRSAEVLVEAAKHHQVLLFTCHPETVKLLGALEPSGRVLEIPRQALNGA